MKLNQINYDLSKPTRLEIKDPITKESFEVPAYIDVYSIESKQGKTAQLNIYRDIMAWKDKNKDAKPNEDVVKEFTVKHLSTLVTGWEGIEDDKGKELKYSEENAIMLLSEYDIIFNTVNIGTSVMGNFTKK